MGYAMERMLGDRIKRGVLVTDRSSRAKVKSEVIVGGHPIPTQGSLVGARRLIELARSATDRTLVVFLISGGGSALVELPIFPEVTLEDLREMNRILVTCGASIRDINTIRKQLSAVKGGRLESIFCSRMFVGRTSAYLGRRSRSGRDRGNRRSAQL